MCMEPAGQTWLPVPKYLFETLRMTVPRGFGVESSCDNYLDKFGHLLQFHEFATLEDLENPVNRPNTNKTSWL